jgi:trimeric autotransporter adhesin
MSTKTLRKRIALVAVSALGFGMVSVVAPSTASAATAAVNVVQAVSLSAGSSQVARVGQSYERLIRISTGSAGAADATIQLNVKFTEVPAGQTLHGVTTGSAGHIAPTLAAGSMNTLVATNAATTVAQSASATPATVLLDPASGENIVGSVTLEGVATMSFVPQAAGVYKILAWADNGSGTDGEIDAGEKSTTLTVTVGGAPSTISISTPAATVATGSTSFTAATGAHPKGGKEGGLVVVRLLDAAGNATRPVAGESVSLTAGSGAALEDASLTAADFNSTGRAATNVYSDVAATYTVTATGIGGLSALSPASLNLTYTAAVYAAITAGTITNTTGVSAITDWSAGTVNSPTARTFSEGKASVTLKFTSSTAGGVAPVVVRDATGVLTGVTGAAWSVPVDLSTGSAGSLTVTTSGLSELLGDSIVVGANMSTDGYVSLAPAEAALDAASTLTPASGQVVNLGGIVLTATCIDQFAQAVAGCSVSWSVAGRNATTVPTTVIANTYGVSTYTLTDVSTSSTASVSTVTAAMSYDGVSNSETAAITFGAANAVSTITATTTPTLTVATTESAISTAATGAASGAVTLGFTVKDANGVVLVGVPVTFTSSLTESGFGSSATDTTDRKLAYTGADGVATTYVYGWKTASTTVTATAGGKTATTTINFANVATDARTIAVTSSGIFAKATVKDRYGNPVKGVTVNWSRTGTGYFGTGATATTGTTDANGETDIATVGELTAKGEILVATYAQADDADGKVGTTATSGIGSTLAPAGVASGTVAMTSGNASADAASAAADAAAEATDAANAATDAANAAAEAADAATAAAQDAADAVAALSTQVSEMVNALKKQITALTNLVIKIQKKVRA